MDKISVITVVLMMLKIYAKLLKAFSRRRGKIRNIL